MNQKMMWAGLVAAIVGAAGCGGSVPPEEGAKGHGGSHAWQETWQGTTTASNPAALPPDVMPCQLEDDPVCHHHHLVVPPGVPQVLVAVKADQETVTPGEVLYSNDYDIYVYDDKNVLVAYYGDPDGDESLVFQTNGSSYYDVRVAPYVVVPGSTFTAVARAVSGQPIDVVADCLEAVPANYGIAGVTDGGERVELSVEVLLDGTDPVRAKQVIAKAAESYAPLGVDLVLRSMRPVVIKSMLSDEIIAEGKAHSSGRPPEGVDIVTVFTSKEMQAYTATGVGTVIGQADCIGGIRWPEHSFAVVTDVTDIESDEVVEGTGLLWNMDAASEVMAHEIGHLMGAHHHYGNCVEGHLTSAGPMDVSPCTLMFPAVNGASLNFGTFEGFVVRGHAVEHAAD